MNDIHHLFFELIQVSLGTRICLSHSPTADEWGELYAMAKKQSLVGVCFAGVQNLNINQPSSIIHLSEILRLQWMGMAVKIIQRNEAVNRQCAELQARLSVDGFASCILKGQGVAALYKLHEGRRTKDENNNLSMLRQSGDIDAWVDTPKEKTVAWAEKVGMTEKPGYLHVGAKVFPDTEVELHYRPTYCRCLWYNKRLQEFCESHEDDYEVRGGIVVPSWEFDVVYQLSHMYRHLFGLGIGLRQLMDYYFVLQAADNGRKTKDEVLAMTLKCLGLYDFAGAVMYVLREVFHLEPEYMIVPVDEKRGRTLLRDVMQSGNFGKMDKEQQKARGSALGTMKYKLTQWWELVRFYPEETLSAPLWSLVRKFD